jgi:hypothetical protein
MPSHPTIRQAHPQDREGVVATVTAAFAQDPGWAFLMGEEYERLAPEFVGALFDLRAPGGNVWVSDDLATVAMKGTHIPQLPTLQRIAAVLDEELLVCFQRTVDGEVERELMAVA